MDTTDPCHESRRLLRIDAAFKAGDAIALRADLDDDDAFPNVVVAPAIGACLTYAIYHGPVSFTSSAVSMSSMWPRPPGTARSSTGYAR